MLAEPPPPPHGRPLVPHSIVREPTHHKNSVPHLCAFFLAQGWETTNPALPSFATPDEAVMVRSHPLGAKASSCIMSPNMSMMMRVSLILPS